MKTIKVKKENFDIDGLCCKITDAVCEPLRAEGIVSSAIMDYFYTSDEEEYFDELDYDIAKEQLYKGNMELALLFATIGSEDNYVACANGKEYRMKDEEDYYEPFPYGCIDEDDEDLYDYYEEDEEEDEIESLDVGVLTVGDETANVLYLECDEDYIYISTAHYGADCIGRPTVLKEENWGELDEIVLEFIKPFIK